MSAHAIILCYDNEMNVLVTGAAGKTGRAVIAALVARRVAVRPFVQRRQSIPGTLPPVIGSMENPDDWARAVQGMEAIYHICPNMHPNEVAIGALALQAARNERIAHFVYHSVLHPQVEAMPHHWNKLRVEELLMAGGLPLTILQPTAYMQNLRANWTAVLEKGVLVLPYPVSSRISLVDVADVGTVAARVLTEPGHVGATYELVGTPPLSPVELAEQISLVLEKEVVAREMALDAWQEQAAATGMPVYAMDTLLAMFRYYAAHGLVGNTTVLRHLLGREPTSLVDCMRRWL